MTVMLFSKFTIAGIPSRAASRVTVEVASTVPCDVLMSSLLRVGTMICGNESITDFWTARSSHILHVYFPFECLNCSEKSGSVQDVY